MVEKDDWKDHKDDHKDLKHDLKELSDSDIEFNDNLLMKVLSTWIYPHRWKTSCKDCNKTFLKEYE